MIDVVIPLGWGSIWDNQELKYSLRSFERHLKGIGNVFIVTDLSGVPKFLNNIIHVPCPDETNLAAVNTYKKILKACKDKRVSENFILSNDDFYLNQDYEAARFPYYHRGEILTGIENRLNQNSHYTISRKITAGVLQKKGFTTFHYGIHCPFLINKTKFLALETMFRWEKARGYLTRCIYGNVYGVQGEFRRDAKLNKRFTSFRMKQILDQFEFFSVGERATGTELYKFFERRYPKPSHWEKQS